MMHGQKNIKLHSFSFLTQRTYSCSNFVAISSLVLELLKKCRGSVASGTTYIFWVCVCSLWYPSCNAHAPSCHLCPARMNNIFPHYLINGTIIETNLLNTKCVLIFSTKLSEKCFILRRNERDMIRNAQWPSRKVTDILVIFWRNLYFLHTFSKNTYTPRGEMSYLAPLGSENISAPYFKQCFFRRGVLPPRQSNATPTSPKTEITNILFYILNFASIIKFKM